MKKQSSAVTNNLSATNTGVKQKSKSERSKLDLTSDSWRETLHNLGDISMSLFVDKNVEGTYSSLQWHSTLPLLAAITENEVRIVSEHGEVTATLNSEEQIKKIVWHPARNCLVLGGSQGKISVSIDGTKAVPVDETIHLAAISSLNWFPQGSKLVSADETGMIVVWKYDGKTELTCLNQYKLNGAIRHIVFLSETKKKDDPNSVRPFIAAGDSGNVYCINGLGGFEEVATLASKITSLLFSQSESMIVTFTEDLLMTQYSIEENSKLIYSRQAKLSVGFAADSKAVVVVWAGAGTIAFCFGSSTIRLLDLVNDENSELTIQQTDSIRINCVSYSHKKQILTAGTDSGHNFFWKSSSIFDEKTKSVTRQWDKLPMINLGGGVEQLTWGVSGTFLVARKRNSFKIIWEQSNSYHMSADRIGAFQISPESISITRFLPDIQVTVEYNANIPIKGIRIDAKTLILWSSEEVRVYDISQDLKNIVLVSKFPASLPFLTFDTQSIYTPKGLNILVCNREGVVKQTLAISNPDSSEGTLTSLETTAKFLVGSTSSGLVQIFDTTRREVRTFMDARNLAKLANVDVIPSVHINISGTMEGNLFYFLFDLGLDGTAYHAPSSILNVWDVERAELLQFDFETLSSFPTALTWDSTDPRVLVTELEVKVSDKSDHQSKQHKREIAVLLVTSEHMIKLHDRWPNADNGLILGCSVPYLYYSKKGESEGAPWIDQRLLRDFVGISITDENTVKSAVKSIKGTGIWENMAKMCIKSKRPDVAAICLSNMGNAVALSAYREAASESPEVKMSVLAIQLNLIEEAIDLLMKSGNYAKLIKLYQSLGQWEDSVKIAETYERIHVKNTYYCYAKHLERMGDIDAAIDAYTKSGNIGTEAPRMLMKFPQKLKQFVDTTTNKTILNWWGKYLETTNDLENALSFYKRGDDHLSIIRVLCLSGKLDDAANLANNANSPAASFHLARQYEASGQLKEAVEWYSKAKCINHAVRLAKEHRMDNDLMQMALLGTKDLILNVASYYEENGMPDKAASLYYKGGNSSKAIEICLATDQHHMLEVISSDPELDADPEVLIKCSKIFLDKGQPEAAVGLLIKSRHLDEALALCKDNKISIDDAMADRMSDSLTQLPDDKKSIFLFKIADACYAQGSYHLACKKYTQAGDRIKAMKSLLRSGDTEKIIFFAGVSGGKQREIFVIAANYLQTLNWRENVDIMKSILSFYTKAKAFDSLSGFYESMAQYAITENSDYDKALGASKEALSCLQKSTINNKEVKIQALSRRIELIEQFSLMTKQISDEPDSLPSLVSKCQSLLQSPDADTVIARGDILALLIETFCLMKQFDQAVRFLSQLQKASPQGNLEYYLDKSILETIRKNTKGAMPQAQARQDDDIEEDIN